MTIMADEQSSGVTVVVGDKPSMAYVLEAINQFNSGAAEVRITARGKAISRAVDVAEAVRRKFVSGARIKSIEIGTEECELSDKSKAAASKIEIVIEK
jgi:DNA-binding protein